MERGTETNPRALKLRFEPIESVGAVITVVEGPDIGATHRIEDIAHRRVLIGHGPTCDIRLTDKTVSRRHASIELTPQGIRFLDLGSKNGSAIGATRIREVFLTPGQEVFVGGTRLRVGLDETKHAVVSSDEARFHTVLGVSPEMRRLFPLFERLAAGSNHFLLEGETGTGKELVAEAIHDAGARSESPFVVFNLSSHPEESVEAALFGKDGQGGALEEAREGTLFIDEVADLPRNAQQRLLRVLERNQVRRGNVTSVDVRVIAATKRNIDKDIQERRFREELFLALATPRIELPPLRKRAGDVPYLAEAFWSALSEDTKFPADLVPRFEQYDWPGNVRELYFAVQRAIASGDVVMPPQVRRPSDDFMVEVIARNLPLTLARQQVVLEFERRYVQETLDRHGGKVGKAAIASGVGRRYFQLVRAGRK